MKQSERLATAFADTLKEWLKPEEMRILIKLNAEEPDKQICHSHDFCDANQAMLDAFEKVFKREMNMESQWEWALVTEAWNLAKANDFYPAPIPEYNNLHPTFAYIFKSLKF